MTLESKKSHRTFCGRVKAVEAPRLSTAKEIYRKKICFEGTWKEFFSQILASETTITGTLYKDILRRLREAIIEKKDSPRGLALLSHKNSTRSFI